MKYLFIGTAISLVVFIALIWAWYGLRALIQHIRCKRLLKKYSRENKGFNYWKKAISNNVPELIEDLKNRGN